MPRLDSIMCFEFATQDQFVASTCCLASLPTQASVQSFLRR